MVDVDDFNLEASTACRFDSLSIYDGSDTSADLIGVYCGTEGPGIVTSTGSSLFLRMESDITGTRSGFHAKYISQGETGGCGTNFTSHAGFISSPNYPEKYDNNADCTFSITGEADKNVTVAFDHFDVEQHTDCDYDSLKIYDGDTDEGSPLATLCGIDMPNPVSSTIGSGLFFRFKSDASVTRTGFSAFFRVQ
ncbi:tolloid-like protein 2 [Strongylocentrotus purpuratus]|uniref:CUB domain-containing protein n=1 Tax=Strongylocentrotus purpuratus TaxID=7668 RepID=A0A7M7STN3_STRPU|nr:tolloid-like protein 2 [Strongylocentrotus purpuratus]